MGLCCGKPSGERAAPGKPAQTEKPYSDEHMKMSMDPERRGEASMRSSSGGAPNRVLSLVGEARRVAKKSLESGRIAAEATLTTRKSIAEGRWSRAGRKMVGKGDSTAETVNKALGVFLPIITRGVEGYLEYLNDKYGGLPLGDPESATYRLRVLDSASNTTQIGPGDLVKQFALKVLHVYVHEDDDDCWMPEPLRPFDRAEIVCVDSEALVMLDFNGDNVAFQVYSQKWYAPTLGKLGIKDVEVQAKIRLWYSPHLADQMFISFLDVKSVRWDLEIALTVLNIPLPDAVEDDWPAWSVKRLLASFDACNPIQATVKPIVFDKEQVKVVKHMHRLAVGRESAEGGAEGGAGGDRADEPQPSTEGNRGVSSSTENRRRSASGRRRSSKSSANPMFL